MRCMIRVLSKKSNLFLLTYISLLPIRLFHEKFKRNSTYSYFHASFHLFIYECIYECILLYLKASFSNLVCVIKIWRRIMKSFAGIFRIAQTLKFGRVILLSRRNLFEYSSAVRIFFTQTIWWEIGFIRKTLICGENTYENVL